MVYIIIFFIIIFFIRFLWKNTQEQTLIQNKNIETEFKSVIRESNKKKEREFVEKLAFPNLHRDGELNNSSINKEKNKMEPIIFKNLTINQRKSIVNFHSAVGLSDGEINYQEAEIITKLCILCRVSLEDCMEYFEHEGGREKLIKNLSTISESEKDILNLSIWNLIVCDEKPNEKELSGTFSVLENIGVSEDDFFESIEKGLQVQKDFSSK